MGTKVLQMNTSLSGDRFSVPSGQLVRVTDSTAKKWLAAGVAVEPQEREVVDLTWLDKPERAVKEPPEKRRSTRAA